MGAPKKKSSELKTPKTFRLSQETVKKIKRAIRSKVATTQTNAIEQAISEWKI